MKKLIVATSNPGKLSEMHKYLDGLDIDLGLKPPELDIEETGVTFLENAILKASQVATTLQQWSIADDSGLMVEALNGQPGIYSARYGKNDLDRINRLLTELKDNPYRQAKFVCAIAVANPEGKIIIQTEEICQGEILTEMKGDGGFGYDPIFYVPEAKKTFAQMTPELKREYSHRGKAFAKLKPLLRKVWEKQS